MRALFTELGLSRDADVLDSGVAVALTAIAAPPVVAPLERDRGDPAATAQSDAVQSMLLGWLGWRMVLTHPSPIAAQAPAAPEPAHRAVAEGEGDGAPAGDTRSFRRRAERRLQRWHGRIVAQWKAFDTLDEAALHDLRKRIKRQRYAVEFFAPLTPRRRIAPYLNPLAAIQERMGELNDLFVARAHYQDLVARDPAAWFALGWIAARIESMRSLAEPELARLAAAKPPRR